MIEVQKEVDAEQNVILSLIVPTRNEAGNIDELLHQVTAVLEASQWDYEVLVADGNSTDGTQARVLEWANRYPVRLIRSDASAGLAGDVFVAARHARGRIVAVMDADLSHPPGKLPELVEPILNNRADMVIGSRYVEGGATPGWALRRRLTSRIATLLARPFVSVKDPLSGFFAIRREQLLELASEAHGFKIALEAAARGDDELRIQEVPIHFTDRAQGHSKFGRKQVFEYLRQLSALAGGTVSMGTGLRFALVGLSGMAVDFLLFNVLLTMGLGIVPAHIAAFLVATVTNYFLNARWAFARSARDLHRPVSGQYVRFMVVCLLALFLRGTVLAALTEGAGWPPQIAILVAIFAAAAVNFIGFAFFVFPPPDSRSTPALRWKVAALCLLAYVFVVRVGFAAVIDLIPEEAYYWMYSKNLDIGYLDHPPMVAWLIWLGTALIGTDELGVRLPAVISWLVAAFFMYRLTRDLFDKTSAFRALLLMGALPIYFGIGLIMTPDAPLYACWAGCLYFLSRALFANRQRAWYAVGICLGLGLLSKYTIALLGPAVLLYLFVDRRARYWLARPQPYLAVLIAVAIFSPVIIWNAQNAWASFVFQGPRRWSEDTEFAFHLLLGSAFVLLTPFGLIGIFNSLFSRRAGDPEAAPGIGAGRRRLFALLFTCVPLSVFVWFSLFHDPKLNWTGPVWLASLPLLAWGIGVHAGEVVSRFTVWGRKLWMPASVLTTFVLVGGLYYLAVGLPGVPAVPDMDLPVAWEEAGEAVDKIEQRISAKTGREPVLVGMDKYFISSQVAFYDGLDDDGPLDTAGRSIVGENSLMWSFWRHQSSMIGSDAVLLAFERDDVEEQAIAAHFTRLGEVQIQPVFKNGRTVALLYWRVGYGYKGGSGTAPLSSVHSLYILADRAAHLLPVNVLCSNAVDVSSSPDRNPPGSLRAVPTLR